MIRGAGNGIRTREYLRNRILSPAPLTPEDTRTAGLAWLGYPRMIGCIDLFILISRYRIETINI
jgi:hypothetical protein